MYPSHINMATSPKKPLASRDASIVAAVLITVLIGGVGLVYFDWRESSEVSVLTDVSAQSTAQEQTDAVTEPISPLPLELPLDGRTVELGKRLFNDPRLSGDGSVSCAHCHNLAAGGVDRLPRSRGIGGREGGINAPTVFNSGFNFRQFWDGRAESLEDQIDGPLQNPAEMGSTWPQAIAALSADPSYRSEFTAIYRDGIQSRTVKDAVATFERSLITPNSRFDRFLRGNPSALNEEEQAGYRLFKQIGCTSCHQGMNIGGNMYQKLGIMEDFFAARGGMSEADMGRFNITKREEDRHFFKVPSLRNVAVTPPYLHDGSAKTLDTAVKVMARYQLGIELNAVEAAKIVAFLHTLTGEYLGKPLE
jgi:cytochrome c peroxidase